MYDVHQSNLLLLKKSYEEIIEIMTFRDAPPSAIEFGSDGIQSLPTIVVCLYAHVCPCIYIYAKYYIYACTHWCVYVHTHNVCK